MSRTFRKKKSRSEEDDFPGEPLGEELETLAREPVFDVLVPKIRRDEVQHTHSAERPLTKRQRRIAQRLHRGLKSMED